MEQQPDGRFQVRVEGVQFDAAHFATFRGKCEPLHGHSYAVAAEVDGTLAEDAWVIDFIELKSMLRSLCRELDHRFLLQRDSRLLQIEERPDGWCVQSPEGVEYVFPATDVVALPIDNTTSERLAEWLCRRLGEKLEGRDGIEAVMVEVWEGPGQRASFRASRLPVE